MSKPPAECAGGFLSFDLSQFSALYSRVRTISGGRSARICHPYRDYRNIRRAHMMTQTPTNAIAAPIKSKRSGRQPSKIMPQIIDRTIKIPPYAAYTRPKADSVCRVGITPYKTSTKPPTAPIQTALPSRSHCQMRYPPPISASPARTNRSKALNMPTSFVIICPLIAGLNPNKHEPMERMMVHYRIHTVV